MNSLSTPISNWKILEQGKMCDLDLKDAYFLIPVHEISRKCLRFIFNGTLFQFTCLLFGLCTSPFIFTKVLKPVMAKMRSDGLTSMIYLGDILCLGWSRESCTVNLKTTVDLLEPLGFIINYKKSVCTPSTRIKYLGFILDSRTMSTEPTEEKRTDLTKLIDGFAKKDSCKIRKFAHLIGSLVSVCWGIEYGNVYCKLLEREKYFALFHASGDYDKKMSFPWQIVKEDLRWWKRNLRIAKNPIREFALEKEIFSDASKSGWGTSCEGNVANGFWNKNEQLLHINKLELLAAFFALRAG